MTRIPALVAFPVRGRSTPASAGLSRMFCGVLPFAIIQRCSPVARSMAVMRPHGGLATGFTRGRVAGSDQDFETKKNGAPLDIPLIVLVDRHSASASEIVAGAVQDHDRGLVVGERTFGKGLVQRVIPLRNGAAVALTTAKYYTPSGRLIQRDFTDLDDYFLDSREDEKESDGPVERSRNAPETIVGSCVGSIQTDGDPPDAGVADLAGHIRRDERPVGAQRHSDSPLGGPVRQPEQIGSKQRLASAQHQDQGAKAAS